MGLYKYCRLPFGIASAPTIWQKAIASVLQGCKGVVYYLDDILVTGKTREEQTQNLKNVMSKLQKFELRLNEAKYKFFQTELELLGHVVTPSWICPTEQRVNNILKAPIPKLRVTLNHFWV